LGYFLIIGIYVLIVTDQPDVTKVKEGGEVGSLGLCKLVCWTIFYYNSSQNSIFSAALYIYMLFFGIGHANLARWILPKCKMGIQ